MLQFLKSPVLYLKMYKNRIVLKNISNGKVREEFSSKGFSNDRLIIADFLEFESTLMSAASDVTHNRWGLSPPLRILCQPMDKNIGFGSTVEYRACQDSCQHAGAKQTKVILRQRELSDSEVLKYMGISSKLAFELID